jgi:hypothetical protein
MPQAFCPSHEEIEQRKKFLFSDSGTAFEDSTHRKEIGNKISQHYFSPVIRTSIEQKFKDLALTWKYNNENISSSTAIILDPAYQEIIGMGEAAVPFIFRELSTSPNLWFWALKSITGVDPVKTENRGYINKMIGDWLDWGRANGYVA